MSMSKLNLAALENWLTLHGYSPYERSAVLEIVWDHRSLMHAVERQLLDPLDQEQAENVLVGSQPDVDYDDPAWDSDDRWELGPAISPDAVLTVRLKPAPPAEPAEPVDWKNWERYRDAAGGVN